MEPELWIIHEASFYEARIQSEPFEKWWILLWTHGLIQSCYPIDVGCKQSKELRKSELWTTGLGSLDTAKEGPVYNLV